MMPDLSLVSINTIKQFLPRHMQSGVLNILQKEGYKNLAQLCAANDRDIIMLPLMGRKGLVAIEVALAKNGLALRKGHGFDTWSYVENEEKHNKALSRAIIERLREWHWKNNFHEDPYKVRYEIGRLPDLIYRLVTDALRLDTRTCSRELTKIIDELL